MTVMEPSTPGPTWEVLTTQPANGRDEMGVYGPGHQVNARLESGATFSVFIPNADLSSIDRVRAIIAAKAAAVDAIVNLKSHT